MPVIDTDFGQATDLYGRLVRATNFALDHWWLWVLVGLVAVVALKLRAQHALIASLDERADAAFGDVDALLIERSSLIGNLAEVVRAFAQKEHDVIRDVLDARVDALEAAAGATVQADTQIAGVLQNLFSVGETYPALARGDHYKTLRADMIRLEDRITAARRFYNLAVEELYAVKRAFPGSLISRRDPRPVRQKFSLGERRAEFAEPVKISL